MIAARILAQQERTNELLRLMSNDRISTLEKVHQLRRELAEHHESDVFLNCESMGALVGSNIHLLLKKAFRQSIRAS